MSITIEVSLSTIREAVMNNEELVNDVLESVSMDTLRDMLVDSGDYQVFGMWDGVEEMLEGVDSNEVAEYLSSNWGDDVLIETALANSGANEVLGYIDHGDIEQFCNYHKIGTVSLSDVPTDELMAEVTRRLNVAESAAQTYSEASVELGRVAQERDTAMMRGRDLMSLLNCLTVKPPAQPALDAARELFAPVEEQSTEEES